MRKATTTRAAIAVSALIAAVGVGPALGASAQVAPTLDHVAAATKVTGVERWDGADRFAASANISANSFPAGVSVAYIASGLIYTDALSGAPVAARDKGPMLLVETSSIPAPIKTELARLKPKKIVILGGTASVSSSVETALAAYISGNGEVERWMGSDRFDASAQISQSAFKPGVDTAYVASGRVFADALSGAPVAGMGSDPLLLTDTTRLPTEIGEELDRLKPKQIIVLGGPASVGDNVTTQLTTYTKGYVTRVYGSDRYAASAAISAASFKPGVPVAYVAYGQVFSDALSGAPVAGKDKGPMLLVDKSSLPSPIKTELERLRPKKIVILGGTASVSSSLESELASYVAP